MLRIKIGLVPRERDALDEALEALHNNGKVYPLTLERLKKRKLLLKGQMSRLADKIEPCISA